MRGDDEEGFVGQEKSPELGYGAREGRWCWVAVGAFIAEVVSLLPFAVRWALERAGMLAWWMETWGEVLMIFGGMLAVVLGFRSMVVLEKEEHAELRGRWMGAVGFMGGWCGWWWGLCGCGWGGERAGGPLGRRYTVVAGLEKGLLVVEWGDGV